MMGNRRRGRDWLVGFSQIAERLEVAGEMKVPTPARCAKTIRVFWPSVPDFPVCPLYSYYTLYGKEVVIRTYLTLCLGYYYVINEGCR